MPNRWYLKRLLCNVATTLFALDIGYVADVTGGQRKLNKQVGYNLCSLSDITG